MKNEGRILFLLAVAQFTHIIDFMIIIPLGEQFMELYQINEAQFSWIVAAYAITAFAASAAGTFFIDKFDRKKAFLFCFFLSTIATWGCYASTDFYTFLAFRSMAGAFGGLLATLIFSIIGDIVPFERRAAATGKVMTAFSAASALGVPAGIYLAAEFGTLTPFGIIGSLGLIASILIFFFIPPITLHLQAGQPKPNAIVFLKQLFENKNQQRALLFNAFLMLGHFTIIPFIAPYMQSNVGFTEKEVGYMYLAGGLLSAVLLPTVGLIADKVGNQLIFRIGTLVAILSIYAITNLPEVAIWVALLVTTSFFFAAGSRSVPATTLITSVVKTENRGSFMSLRAMSNQFIMGISSLFAGVVMVKTDSGAYENYEILGYFTIAMSIAAVLMVNKLKPISS